jgi:ABC-2 type transport system ATP-binding protein
MDEAHVLCDEIAIMDAGRIIASGAPDDLLRSRYDGLVIELPVEDLSSDLEGIEHVVYENQGIVEIVSTDVSRSLETLAPRVVNLNRIKIRQPNLEDLFLDLTGHSLRS